MPRNSTHARLPLREVANLWDAPSAAFPRPLLIALRLVILGLLGNRYCYFVPQTYDFAGLVPSLLASCGSLGRSRGTWEYKKRHVGIQASIFLYCGVFPVPILRAPGLSVHACSQVAFSADFCRSESGCLGLEKTKNRIGIAKTIVAKLESA